MPVHDELGKRMKQYEAVSKTVLMRRTPVAIRIDGKAFHTFTRSLQKPFDHILMCSMIDTMEALCKNVQNCVFGYTQSDEITLILVDYKELNTAAWFDNEVQKLCSISASMATFYFNKFFAEYAERTITTLGYEHDYSITLAKCIDAPAMFDARCFNIPKEEVTNLLYWRQLDAIRNSIQSMGQSLFSHKELMNKSCAQIKEMIETTDASWDGLPTYRQRGTACFKSEEGWTVDYSMPILVREGREYVERHI